jgi:hypothetical protein
MSGFTCAARAAGKTDPPQDCDWPWCGCDPHADKVIAHLQECNMLREKVAQEEPTQANSAGLIARLRKLAAERATNAGGNDPCPPEAECDDCDTVRVMREAADALEALSSSAPVERPTAEPTDEQLVANGLRRIRLLHAWFTWRSADRRVTDKRAKLAEDAFFAGVAAADRDRPVAPSQTPEERPDKAQKLRERLVSIQTKVLNQHEEIERLRAELAREEKTHGNTIDARDRAQEMADELAERIVSLTVGGEVEDVIGEHTSSNCPWRRAIELADGHIEAQPSSETPAKETR